MIRPLLLLMPTVALLAADLPLGTPRLHLWRDGAALQWTVDLPPGDHTALLPTEQVGTVTVTGAAWRLEERSAPAGAEPLPPAWEVLRQERNAWAAERLRWTATADAHQAQGRRLERALPGVTEFAGAQAALEAWLAEDAARVARDTDLTARHGTLQRRAQDLLGPRARGEDLLALHQVLDHPVLTAEELAAAWARRPRPEVLTRVLHLTGTGPARISLAVEDVTWTPAATLAVAGTTTTLHRQARVTKPASWDLGTIPVTVSTTAQRAPLTGPEARPANLHLRDLHPREGSTVAVGQRDAAAETPPVRLSAIDPPSAAPKAEVGQAAAADAAPLADPPGLAETWDLGPLVLGAGATQVIVDRPAAPVTVVDDQVALWPESGPMPQRRLGIRLDDRPLQAGPLTLVVDGATVATQTVPATAPASVLWFLAGEDAQVYAADPQPWDLTGEDLGPRRRISGATTRLHNLGTAPRTVTVMRTLPVPRSEGLAIVPHPRTTPGGRALEPGLWTWTLTLPPGGSVDFAQGWVATSDRLDL
jgi:hypothetical protein